MPSAGEVEEDSNKRDMLDTLTDIDEFTWEEIVISDDEDSEGSPNTN